MPLVDDNGRRGFIEDVRARVGAEMAAEADKTIRGGATDYPAYRERVGRHKGLARALDIVNECIKDYLVEVEDR